MQYSAGFVVHDIDRPHIVRYRSQTPRCPRRNRRDPRHRQRRRVPDRDLRARRPFVRDLLRMADARIGRAHVQLAAPNANVEESPHKPNVALLRDRDGHRLRDRKHRICPPYRDQQLDAARGYQEHSPAGIGQRQRRLRNDPVAVVHRPGQLGAQRPPVVLHPAVRKQGPSRLLERDIPSRRLRIAPGRRCTAATAPSSSDDDIWVTRGRDRLRVRRCAALRTPEGLTLVYQHGDRTEIRVY